MVGLNLECVAWPETIVLGLGYIVERGELCWGGITYKDYVSHLIGVLYLFYLSATVKC